FEAIKIAVEIAAKLGTYVCSGLFGRHSRQGAIERRIVGVLHGVLLGVGDRGLADWYQILPIARRSWPEGGHGQQREAECADRHRLTSFAVFTIKSTSFGARSPLARRIADRAISRVVRRCSSAISR